MNSEPEELGPGDSLAYYVVTLTWRAHTTPEEVFAKEVDASAVASTTFDPPVTSSTAPVTAPSVSYNRLNAVPTFYG